MLAPLPPFPPEPQPKIEDALLARLDKIIELLEARLGMLITAQEEADEPEEVDRGYLDG